MLLHVPVLIKDTIQNVIMLFLKITVKPGTKIMIFGVLAETLKNLK